MADGNGATSANGRDVAGRFVGGDKLSPGRPKGSRHKLSEAFLSDLHRAWLKHGKKVLEHCAVSDPPAFLRAAVSVLPKVLDIESTLVTRTELSVEIADFKSAWEAWGRTIGAEMPELIELQPEAADETSDE